MAEFNYNMPNSRMAPRRREFSGNWWSRAKVNLSGSKTDGSANLWGDIVGKGLSPVLGVISAYYTGSYALGDKVGDFANQGLQSWTNKQLRGTEGADIAKEQYNDEQKIRSVISSVGNTAAGIYNAAGGPTNANKPASGTRKENRMLDKALKGVSDSSIGEYIADNASSTFDYADTLSSLGALANAQKQGQNKNSFNPSAMDPNGPLAKFFSMQEDDFGLGGLINNYGTEQKSAGKDLNLGQSSSTTGIIGDGIRALDDKKKNKPSFNFESSLPYSSPDGFADGGKPIPKPLIKMAPKKVFYSLEGIKKKTPSHLA